MVTLLPTNTFWPSEHSPPDHRATADVDEMPDAGAVANDGAGVNDGGFVLVMAHDRITLGTNG